MQKEMRTRFKDTIVNTIAWLPVFAIGAVCFWLATGLNPEGTLFDFRIKMLIAVGKSFMAVYFGEILWNMLFPKLDEKTLIAENLENIPAKLYNIMYGRLILHFIMQLVFIFG
jgi:hypothetical protein